MPDQAHQLAGRMKRERARAPLKLQPRFFGSAVTLAVVAGVAGRDQILPGRAPAARTRHHVVQGQLRSRKRGAAKLTSIPIAQQDILPGERATLLGNMPIGQ